MTEADGAGPGWEHGRRPVRALCGCQPCLNVEVWLVTGSGRFAAANRDAQEVCGQPEYSAVIRLS
jgi:hypothetical protein